MRIRTVQQLEQYVRDQGITVTTPGGGWVSIHGNRSGLTPRGARILPVHRAAGMRHLDIYWAINERMVVRPKIPRLGFSDTCDEGEYNCPLTHLRDPWNHTLNQVTWMDLVTPYPGTIRVFNGEVTATSDELIGELLNENCLDTIHFGGENPIWAEATRDIMDSLRLDGLSYGEAQNEVVTLGLIKEGELKTPKWFYRPTGWYYHNFCEEPEYHELVKRGIVTVPEIPAAAFS